MRPGLKRILLISESRMGGTSAAETVVMDIKAAVQAGFSI